MSSKKVYLTEQGLADLKEELDVLINERRPQNIQAIKEARSLGDLSENADYDAAKNEQAQIEGRIKTIEKMLENVEIIKETSKDVVGLLLSMSMMMIQMNTKLLEVKKQIHLKVEFQMKVPLHKHF